MSTISAGTSVGTALVNTGDTTGQLDLRVNGTTQAVRINTSGAIGVGTSPAFGTSGQVLTSNGSASAPTWAAPAGFPSGTVLIFAQTNAPTGWTKNTSTGDNSALRVVTGTASTGGSVAFTTAFASQTPTINTSGLSAGATTLSTAQIPSHTHPLTNFSGGGSFGAPADGSNNPSSTTTTVAAGGGGSHTHTISGSATSSAINLAVQYIDVIRATKD
jgi:hypothetical protein